MPRLPRKVARRHRRPSPAQGRHPVASVPRLPRKTTADVSLCHACHVKRRWMSSCATPATQSAAASQAPNPGPRAPPSTICAMPATQNDGRCDFVPRLPRETTVDVRLCHACHAKWRGVTGAQAQPKAPKPSPRRPSPAQGRHPVASVPRLPRKTTADVSLCHACHVKRRWMSSCAKVYGDKVCGDKVCVDEVFVDKVCVDNLCGDKVCGDKVCVDEVARPKGATQ